MLEKGRSEGIVHGPGRYQQVTGLMWAWQTMMWRRRYTRRFGWRLEQVYVIAVGPVGIVDEKRSAFFFRKSIRQPKSHQCFAHTSFRGFQNICKALFTSLAIVTAVPLLLCIPTCQRLLVVCFTQGQWHHRSSTCFCYIHESWISMVVIRNMMQLSASTTHMS